MAGPPECLPQMKALMEEARALLSEVALEENPGGTHVSNLQGKGSLVGARVHACDQDGRMAEKMVARCVCLLEDVIRLPSVATSVDGQSWTVLRAVTEQLVRIGICPYLSEGVGIPLQKRFGGNSARAAAAAAAVSHHQVHEEASRLTNAGTASGARESLLHPVVLSTEFLSSLLRKDDLGSSSGAAASSGSDGKHHSEPGLHDGRGNVDRKLAGATKRQDGEGDLRFSAHRTTLRQLVLSHHLVDVFAGVLQIGYGPPLKDTNEMPLGFWTKGNAAERMKILAGEISVEHVVEALFILLGDSGGKEPGVPPWLKSQVGKLLSLVVMREAGVAAILERLVGKVEKGSMHVFEKVATQLARVPRSVASKEMYYRDICKQLQPLLILQHSHSKDASKSTMAAQVLDNMQITVVMLACKMGLQDPVLVEKHLTQPIVEPLLSWGALQLKSVREKGTLTVTAMKNHSTSVEGEPLSEDLLFRSFLKAQVLLTAGHEGARRLQQQVLNLTSHITTYLLALSYLLWPTYTKPGFLNQEEKFINDPNNGVHVHRASSCEEGKNSEPGNVSGGDIPNKILLSASTVESQKGELVDAVFDFAQAHLAASSRPGSRQLTPTVYDFLVKKGNVSIVWPTNGNTTYTLAAERRHPSSACVFASKLLRWSENWALALALVGAIIRNLSELKHTRTQADNLPSEKTKQELILQLGQDLEIIIAEVGLQAAHQDPCRSMDILKDLLDDERLSQDEDILVKLLRLLRSALSQLQSEEGSVDTRAAIMNGEVQASVFCALSSSVEKLQGSRAEMAILTECVEQLRFLRTIAGSS